MKRVTIMAAAAALGACNGATAPSNDAGNAAPATAPPAAVATNDVVAPVAKLPPLLEPKGPIDPKSAEAAGQVVQRYGALVEEGRFAEARDLWGHSDFADAFARQLKGNRETHLEIGDLGDMEGAAGSIYITESVTFYGKSASGAAFRKPAEIVLRRVNDVDGSTAAQRRWHIDQINWK